MYSALFKTIASYWRDYGGLKEFSASPFLHVAVGITLLYAFDVIHIDWRVVTLSSLPTMLGFSLAAYTITFTLMGSALHRALSTAIDKKSGTPLIKMVNATFFHIVLFQTIALIYALTTKGDFFWRLLRGANGTNSFNEVAITTIVFGGDILGCFFSIYAILLLFSVSFAMFRLGRLSTLQVSSEQPSEGISPQRKPTAADTKPLRFAVVRFVAKALRIY